jgi:Acyl-CoA dehydrogenase, C-terminal domain
VSTLDLEREVRESIRAAAKESLAFSHARLVDLGWDELVAAEPELAVVTLFEEMGRLRLTGPALDAVVLMSLAGPYDWDRTKVLYPQPGRLSVAPAEGQLVGFTFDEIDDSITHVLVPVSTESGVQLELLPAGACRSTPVGGLDDSAGLHRVTADRSAGVPADTDADWTVGLAAARRALSHQLIGTVADLLAIAVEHVTVREQFGRPLGANQAVQHRLADAKVELSAAEELAAEAWSTASPFAATVAKGMSSRALNTVAAHGQQVLGGIGFTWEHSWRHPLRRGMFLSVLLGSADDCDTEIGGELIRSGIVRLGALSGLPA